MPNYSKETRTSYFPCWVNNDEEQGKGIPKSSEKDCILFFEKRNDSLKKADKSQWIEKITTITEIIEITPLPC